MSRKSTKIESACLYCRKVFMVFPSEIKKGGGRFCSAACYHKSKTSRDKNNRTCPHCGERYYIKKWQIKQGRHLFCSRLCRDTYLTQQHNDKCEVCGIRLSPTKHWHNRFCSRKCLSIGIAGNKSHSWRGGKKQYRGANWNSQRKVAYERDMGICQYCHRKKLKGERQFQVHHIKPFREFNGDYIAANDLLNLITLCHQCHPKAEHGLIPVPKRLL